jgi:hypothetical protein
MGVVEESGGLGGKEEKFAAKRMDGFVSTASIGE